VLPIDDAAQVPDVEVSGSVLVEDPQDRHHPLDYHRHEEDLIFILQAAPLAGRARPPRLTPVDA
jgi:hypothetical protein